MGTPQDQEPRDRRVLRLEAALLAVWAAVAFAFFFFFFFARDLQFVVAGAVPVFIAIMVVHAAAMNRLVPEDSQPGDEGAPHV